MYNCYLHAKKLQAIPYNIFDSWERMLDTPVSWDQVFTNLYGTIIDTRARYFRYKFIYKYLVKWIKGSWIWGKESPPSCRFCKEEEDTTDNLFWYCSPAALFRIEVERWLLWHNVILRFNLFTVLLGDLSVDAHTLQNIIILFNL